MTPPPDPLVSFAPPAMASSARIRSLSLHSCESLERIAQRCCSAALPLPRLEALAEELLSQRQMANPPSCPVWIRPEELPF